MRALSDDLSLDAYWEDLTYLEASLCADPTTEPMAAPIVQHLQRLDPLIIDDRASRRRLILARTRVKRFDADVDLAIRALHADVLKLAHGDEDAPVYRAVFAYDLPDIVRYGLSRQLKIAARMAARINTSHDYAALANLDHHTRSLTNLQITGVAALNTREEAERLHAAQRAQVKAWKDAANALRSDTYAALLDLQEHRNGARAWARTFFQAPGTAASRPSLTSD